MSEFCGGALHLLRRTAAGASLGVVVTALSPPLLFGAMAVYAVLWFPVMCPCL